MPVFWAGKRLDADEELSLRRVVALLRRIEGAGRTEDERRSAGEDRTNLERFLPENAHKWTPDELEFGAHNGPWFEIGEATAG
jgi:hypothetical protein